MNNPTIQHLNNTDWDEWNRAGGPSYPHAKVIQYCFRHFPPETRASVHALDFGCGGGVNTAFMAREGFQVTGIDGSSVGVQNTRQRLLNEELEGAVHWMSLEELDLMPASFNLMICIGVLECTGPELADKAMNLLMPALAPGASALFVFASDQDYRSWPEARPQLYGYSRQEVDALFDHKFKQLQVDRYITTFDGGQREHNDWLVTASI